MPWKPLKRRFKIGMKVSQGTRLLTKIKDETHD